MKNLQNYLAFSLIELSIVLIIIGLLVAGVTGGASLVESARLQSLINEIRGYEQDVYAFKVARDRLPGDINKDGRFGENSGEVYDSTSFPAPYNTNSNDYKIPSLWSGFFVDLYLEGIIDFQPKNTSENVRGVSVPFSKVLKNLYYYPWYFNETLVSTESGNILSYNYGKKLGNNLVFQDYNSGNPVRIPPKFLKKFDMKFDDGNWQGGRVRSYCKSSLSYDEVINLKDTCYFSIIELNV